jgi:nicotinamidase-related amidase
MTTLTGRTRSALIVIDAQKDVMEPAHDRDAVIARIATLVDQARSAATPVIWVQHSAQGLEYGTAAWEIVPELRPLDSEPVVHKTYGDAFEDTNFEEELALHHVAELVVVGGHTDACVRATIHGGFVRGYDVTLVSDAHTTEDLTEWGAPPPADVIAHANFYWPFQRGPGRTSSVVESSAVSFA